MTNELDARARMLAVAEQLFMSRGYNGVTLRDIAEALGLKHSAVYYHAPGGKDELFAAVVRQALARHRGGLQRAIAAAPPTLRERLRAVVGWFLSQPPVDMVRLIRSDIAALPPAQAQPLMREVYETMHVPVAELFAEAHSSGEIRATNPDLLAGAFLGILNGIELPATLQVPAPPPAVMMDELIDLFMRGLVPT
jgi:TetR/AcrR family transcriptional regulator, cholesterol catabolism regulator